MTFPRRYCILHLLLFCYSCIRHNAASCDVQQQQQQQQQRQMQLQQQRETDVEETPSLVMEGPYNPHLLFQGILKNDLGESVEGALVQFWHADYHGNYFHPGDDLDGKELIIDSFSYFGTATTNNTGSFEFKTYRPGIYVSRPVTHIHFKVFYEGRVLLTSQFYFADENVQRWFDDMLILTLEESIEDDGNVFHHTSKEVVVNMNMGGYQKLTPTQVEGPFYPLVDFFNVSSDMTLGLLDWSDDPTAFGSSTSTEDPTTTSSSQPSTDEPTPTPIPIPITPKPTQKPTRKPTSKPTSHIGLEGPDFDNMEDFLAFIDAGSGNATMDGNSTLNFSNDTDADDDEEESVDILLDDEISINGVGDDNNDDDETSVSNDVEELSSVGGNSTSAALEETSSVASSPTVTPTTKPTEKQKYPKPSINNNKEDEEDDEKHKGDDSDSTSPDDGTRFLRSRK